jgi:hypothetical protein
MKKIVFTIVMLLFLLGLTSGVEEKVITKTPQVKEDSANRLAVLWTSGDPEVAKKMVFVYVYNAKKNQWFKEIRLIIWGASTKLLSQDPELQKWIQKLKKMGIKLFACKWCSDSYGVSDLLTRLGINVIYYGKPLTKLIKANWKILTF